MIVIFAYDGYYPAGGARDLVAVVQTAEEMFATLPEEGSEYAHAYDVDKRDFVGNWKRARLEGRSYATGPWEDCEIWW